MESKYFHIPENAIVLGEEKMTSILDSLITKTVRLDDSEPVLPFVKRINGTYDPKIVFYVGNTSAVFELGNCGTVKDPYYLVAKVAIDKEPDDKFYLFGLDPYKHQDNLEESVRCLEELGEEVVPHIGVQYGGAQYGGAQYGSLRTRLMPIHSSLIFPFTYHICPDLRWCGENHVFNISKFPFHKYKNGDKLLEDCRLRIKSLLERLDYNGSNPDSDYTLIIDRDFDGSFNGSLNGVENCLMSTLVGMINVKNGRPYFPIADLDHCAIGDKGIIQCLIDQRKMSQLLCAV